MIFKSPIKFSDPVCNLKSINQWKCFGCCHVRTATIIVGLWHLAIHIMGFFLFVVATYIVPTYYCDSPTLTTLPLMRNRDSDLTVQRVKHDYDGYSDLQSISTANESKVWMLMSALSLVATVSLICGATKKKSPLILPFFFLQIFDILFDITIIGVYFVMSSSITEFFGELYNAPFQQFVLHFGFYQKIVFTCAYILLALFIKVYLVCIVYLCYRYLTNYLKYSQDVLLQTNAGSPNNLVK
ncbi:lysosomal-associated transmembrane protein 4B [Planococcus citri]|uniref:lysosomal-associated transmembrane protein 4B n=1 Tax=Planococcus citri TaxID=170843 RepID=UPI0031F72D1F